MDWTSFTEGTVCVVLSSKKASDSFPWLSTQDFRSFPFALPTAESGVIVSEGGSWINTANPKRIISVYRTVVTCRVSRACQGMYWMLFNESYSKRQGRKCYFGQLTSFLHNRWGQNAIKIYVGRVAVDYIWSPRNVNQSHRIAWFFLRDGKTKTFDKI